MSHAHPDEYVNTEAGPSTLVLPPVPYVDQLTSQPPGGITEATADADTIKQSTEEDRATVSSFYWSHIPRVTEWSFGVRSPSRPGSLVVKGNHVRLSH